jgi:general secretion pathway protein N
LSITQERPIFSPSRRPPPPATPTYVAPVAVRTPQKPKEPERPSITLLGTILGSSESIGIFLNPATRDIVRLLLGEAHDGWALRSVKAREVTLVKDRDRVVLELPPPGDQAAAIDSPPPAAPQRRGRK